MKLRNDVWRRRGAMKNRDDNRQAAAIRKLGQMS